MNKVFKIFGYVLFLMWLSLMQTQKASAQNDIPKWGSIMTSSNEYQSPGLITKLDTLMTEQKAFHRVMMRPMRCEPVLVDNIRCGYWYLDGQAMKRSFTNGLLCKPETYTDSIITENNVRLFEFAYDLGTAWVGLAQNSIDPLLRSSQNKVSDISCVVIPILDPNE